MSAFDQNEPFDTLIHNFLGKYVYVLIDPEDGRPFYVGQGTTERVGGHFEQARAVEAGNKVRCEKTDRIRAIWSAGKKVGVAVVRRRLRDDMEASHVEGAVMQSLRASGIKLTNKVQAPLTDRYGWATIQDVRRYAAPPLNPTIAIKRVHLFKIENGICDRLKAGGSPDDENLPFLAMERSWYPSSIKPQLGYAVGYIGNPAVSIVACKIADWAPCNDGSKRWYIRRDENIDPVIIELCEKNWSRVVTARGGAASYGSPVQVRFDGRGAFQYLWGVQDQVTQHSLAD